MAAVRDDEVLEPGEGASAPIIADASTAARAVATRAGAVSTSPDSPDLHPWHRFPRGALAGNFLHDQLEWLADEDFALDTSEALQQQLVRRCERQGWGHRAPDVLAWLRRVVNTPLPPVGSTLAAMAGVSGPVPELEFWLPSAGLPSRQIDLLCCRHLLAGRDRPALPERDLRGMLMGFADIVFAHGGKYWVLDYKSNYLGAEDADYRLDALEGAMAMHRYDVQAAIYLLALHRLLRSRLGAAYDPAEHLGGAVYLFMRGIDGPEQGCYHVPPPIELLDQLDSLLGYHHHATETTL